MLSVLASLGLLCTSQGHAQPAGAPAAEEREASLPPEDTESPELREIRLAELEIFGNPDASLAAPAVTLEGPPAVLSSTVSESPSTTARGTTDLDWLQGLSLPDLPVRWDERVIRYLEFFRDDPRGHATMGAWLRRSHRYGQAVRAELRNQGLPEDLLYVAMIESGFDPQARSDAGAVGLWQFVNVTGDEYELRRNHWIDQRMDPQESTAAAARFLRDLYTRFGSWELSLAAYNMGYASLLRAIRKYNTNDYWVLSRFEAGLPFETTLYVAKAMACAIIARNLERFGFADVGRDPEQQFDTIEAPAGTALGIIARAAGTNLETIRALNPQFRRARVEPGAERRTVRIPHGRTEAFSRAFGRMRPTEPEHRTVVVRFGETLTEVARRYRTGVSALRQLNELGDSERVGVGFQLLVPDVEPREEAVMEQPVIAVANSDIALPGRRRVFYRVVAEDRVRSIAQFFSVTADELRQWNRVDPGAELHPGIILQLFVRPEVDLARAVVLSDNDVRVLVVGSEEFFEYQETQQGRVRFRYTIGPGDTLTGLAQRFGLSIGSIARINQFDQNTLLRAGEQIVIYAPPDRAPPDLVPPEGPGDEQTPAAEVAASEPLATADPSAVVPNEPAPTSAEPAAQAPATSETTVAPGG